MSLFDTIRFPVNRQDLTNGDLLDRLPVYLRNKWWVEVQQLYHAEYKYNNETPEAMRWWLRSLNDHRLEPHMYLLRDMISKYGE